MHPVLFGPVKSYGFLLALSFLVGMALSLRRGRRQGVEPAVIYDLVFLVLITSLVGVRLAYVLTHLSDFRSLPQVLAIWDGGLTLYGGILLATFAVWWFCRRRRLGFLKVADILAPGVILGIGITRLGCFMAGCCYGKPCDLPWAVHFPPGSEPVRTFGAQGLHPSQLYGSAGGFLVFALLLLVRAAAGPRGRDLRPLPRVLRPGAISRGLHAPLRGGPALAPRLDQQPVVESGPRRRRPRVAGMGPASRGAVGVITALLDFIYGERCASCAATRARRRLDDRGAPGARPTVLGCTSPLRGLRGRSRQRARRRALARNARGHAADLRGAAGGRRPREPRR